MDLRVLAAVFLTLFAVAMGMAQGNVDLQEVMDSVDNLRTSGDLSAILDRARSSTANSSITGTITTTGAADLEIGSPSRLELSMRPSDEAEVGDSTLQTAGNTSVVVEGFRGSIHVSRDNITVAGTAAGISTDSFDFSYSSPKRFKFHSGEPHISVQGLERQTFKFENATGTVTAGGTTVEVDEERAWFHGFTGNMSAEGTTYELAGRVQSATLGDAQIG